MKITKKMLVIAGLCVMCIFVAALFTVKEIKKPKNKVNVTLTQEIVDDASNTSILNEKTATDKKQSATNNGIDQEEKKSTNDLKNNNISINQNDSITTNNKMENDKTDSIDNSENNNSTINDKNYVETYIASEYELPTVFFD